MSRERPPERSDPEIVKKIKREPDHHSRHHHHHATAAANPIRRRHIMLGPPGSGSGSGTLNTITPCAACKLLRRRCSQECPFSPYFSPHDPQRFASVHKVFGASNVSKLLSEVPESQRADAANSLVYEANVRLRDPVYGCMGAISALHQQVQSLQAELNAVRAEILKYKYSHREAAANNNNIVNSQHHHHHLHAHVALLSSGAISVAAPPPTPPTPPPAAQHPPPPPSQSDHLPSSSSSSSSMYTQPSSSAAADYNNENVSSYFG